MRLDELCERAGLAATQNGKSQIVSRLWRKGLIACASSAGSGNHRDYSTRDLEVLATWLVLRDTGHSSRSGGKALAVDATLRHVADHGLPSGPVEVFADGILTVMFHPEPVHEQMTDLDRCGVTTPRRKQQ